MKAISTKALIPVYFLGCLFFFSCKRTQNSDPVLFKLMDHTGINFINEVKDDKLENSFLFRNFYNGGGVAIGDINNDGLADVMLTSNQGENKLYLNKGNFQFVDITPKSGMKQDSMWSTGVVFADVNGDGWLDIYVCNSGHMKSGNRRNKLYINNHNLTFTESAAKYGLDIKAYTTQVSFFDYDGDGDLDCFMIDNSPIPVNILGYANRRDLPADQWPVADFLKGGGDHLYRNDDGHFTEVTKQAGIHGSIISFGLGVSVGDINNDGYPDIFVSNDSYERDYLYINQKDGTFKDEYEQCMAHGSFSSMGADLADINNDGYSEIFTTDMLPGDDFRLKTLGSFDNIDLFRSKLKAGFYYQYMKNCLQLNNKNGTFSEISNYSGVPATDWSWGALMFDADNDGFNDIYVCNGVNHDVTNLDFMEFFANDVIQKMVLTGKKEDIEKVLEKIPVNPMQNKAFRNEGNLRFKDIGTSWGFTQASFSNGAAYGDLDNDGDLDLVVNNENQPAFVFQNNARQLTKNNYIGILLKEQGKNTFAIGSKIKIYKNNEVLFREVVPSRGFQSSMDYKQIIGLGKSTTIDSLVVVWPDRTCSRFLNPAVDSVYIIEKPIGTEKYTEPQPLYITPLLDSIKNNYDKHVEDDNIDFYYERNIPEMLSKEGPKAAVGDVNGDGLEDVFIGGTQGHPGQLYIQTTSGGFIKKKEPAFELFSEFEDDAVLFFDVDHDGDLDLFVGAGGNSYPPYSRQMQHRLFKNNGKGDFTLDDHAFPSNGMNIAVAIANDFDHDGDLDLFVGSRNVPREYGSTPESYIYVNDGQGHFTDIAKTKCPDIASIGMVTSAVWADINNDGNKELIIAGEWMTPRIFTYNGDRFVEMKTNLGNMYGLWQTIAAADVNGDGKTDLILGNLGENFNLHPDEKNPVKLWINDYNGNGSLDKILTRTYNGKDVPVFLKHEIQDAIPGIKKQNLKHEDYAKKSMQELFPQDVLNKSTIKTFNYISSCVAINNGKGNFTIQNLPVRAQLSSVNAIHCSDLNNDGHLDLVLGGNESGFIPQLERLDASYGDVFLNNGNGSFTWQDASHSGLLVKGDVKDIRAIKGKNGNYLLFLRNDNYPVLFKINDRINKKIANR